MKDYRQLARLNSLISYQTDNIYYNYEKKCNISDAEACLIYALDEEGPHSQKQICEDWNMQKTTLNTLIKQWEKLAYIELVKMAGKKRECEIVLTEKGKQHCHEYLDFVYQVEEAAIKETLEKYPEYLEAAAFYEKTLRNLFESEEESCLRK